MTSRGIRSAGLVALSALLLTGCSMGSGGSDQTASEPDVGLEAPADGGVAPRDEQPFTEDEQAGTIEEDRSVITTGWMAVTVDDPIDSAAEVAAIVGAAGGRVDGRNETPGTETQQARATLVVRIPADRFDAVLGDLRELGDVDSVRLDASDVTQQKRDLDSRIASLETSVDRLRALIAQADDVGDLIAIESELTTRQTELDALTTQRDWLADQVDYSTLTVELLSEGLAPQAGPNDFWSGVVAGWNALTAFVSGLLVAIGVMLPWLALLAVIAAIVVGIIVLASRGGRRAQGTAGTSGSGAEPGATGQPTSPVGPGGAGTDRNGPA
ncbi:DUF4349 domain-containing protein [Agromyces binzhouensis]|uniref:DUF4349 domain-containing protein n=1 Tax=Agromyces binzhouensis TaxID=1817495 RepID=A0A4Q2JNW7_9MICO|nr:DUF4349 domain-containing protein [Agromyces binzhouensis]RXZ48369.1 DUF4349 domain-containing protein [Agromyces binzhouensis]